MNLFAITNLLCGAFCLLLGIFAILVGKSKVYRLLAWFNFAVSVWGFGTFSASISSSHEMALTAWRISHSGGYFIAALFYHLVCCLTESKHKKIQFLGYAQAVIFIFLTCGTPWVLLEMRSYYNFFYPVATLLYAIAVFFYLLFVLLSFVELVRHLKKSESYKKRQAQYLFYGFFIGFTGGTSLLLPEFYIDGIYPAGNAGVFIYAAIVTYVVLHHKIMDTQQMMEAFQREKLAAIGTMAASLNHELRNPLYIAKGKAEAFLDGADRGIHSSDARTMETVGVISSQLARALEIMQRFSSFAKPLHENSRSQKVDVNETFKNVLQMVSAEFEMRKIKVAVAPSSNISVSADPRQFEEILFNLIVNACHSMEQGGELTLSACQPNGKVIVEVSDTGSGIAKDRQKKIFDPFYTTKTEKGTGLGLYITKQLVERNGGRISVKSRPGAGTTFRLELAGV